MQPRQMGMLVILAAIWGASYLFIRVASPALGPMVLMEGRVSIAGLALLGYAVATGRPPRLRAQWRQFLVLGALASAAPFTLVAAGELYITASLAGILNATTPLFTAVVAAIWLQERITPHRAAGMLIGITGVGILTGWSPLALGGGLVFGTLALLLSSFSYALGAVYAGRVFRATTPLTISIGQQLGAAVVLLPFAAVGLPRAHPTSAAIADLLALALLSTGVAYLIYYPLLQSIGPTRTFTVTFLIPVFGLLWGALFLHERIGAGTVVGLAVILSSVTLVTGIRLFPQRSRHARAAQRPAAAGAHESDLPTG